jgi:hypothetical protein
VDETTKAGGWVGDGRVEISQLVGVSETQHVCSRAARASRAVATSSADFVFDPVIGPFCTYVASAIESNVISMHLVGGRQLHHSRPAHVWSSR